VEPINLTADSRMEGQPQPKIIDLKPSEGKAGNTTTAVAEETKDVSGQET